MNEDHSSRFAEAIRRFDQENARDPHTELVNGTPEPRELAYARWLSAWVLKLCPEAPEHLQLASRCQHICRWKIPRSQYELNKGGYLRWRSELKQLHARIAGNLLREVGYPDDVIKKVQDLNLKKNFPADPESRVLEDALCLVFLEHQLADLADRTEEEKVINALRKSWKKMTDNAHALALQLPLRPRDKQLIERALQG